MGEKENLINDQISFMSYLYLYMFRYKVEENENIFLTRSRAMLSRLNPLGFKTH